MTNDELQGIITESADRLLDTTDNDTARYCLLRRVYGLDYNDPMLTEPRRAFLADSPVRQLRDEQDRYGGWGPMFGKDYSAAAVFPTTATAIERCRYLGLDMRDCDILFDALELIHEYLRGRGRERLGGRNERAVPWSQAELAALAESISPRDSMCDELWQKWAFIAGSAFANGEYDYDGDARAQHELFGTHEARLVPLPLPLLLSRRDELPRRLEDAMLRHFGADCYEHGWFWREAAASLPAQFAQNNTRRYLYGFRRINMFRGSAMFLERAVEWLASCRADDLMWDWGSQRNDPWGYFRSFSTGRSNSKSRRLDCTMEILLFLSEYVRMNQ